MNTIEIHVKGTVQGVGFRPFVYSLAQKYKLNGKVWNTSNGVEILLHGKQQDLNGFIEDLHNNAPPLARIDSVTVSPSSKSSISGFEIVESQSDPGSFLPISPDICICEDCRKELFDPNNRRYRYPFINCTNCGPRLTIIHDIPYDRSQTTMSVFTMCEDCRKEYINPENRRFHAQPIACPVCGPSITFFGHRDSISTGEEALAKAREFLSAGKIIAVKGLGGYHIACDARNLSAVTTLIERKHRSEKPLALMAFDEQTIEKYCEISANDSKLLNSYQHPIVLLQKNANCSLPDKLAIRQNCLGFMLPYTPLHLLLLEPGKYFSEVLVMTSGNMSEEPIAFEDNDAIQRLSPLVDGFLTHNREIKTRIDDSVASSVNNRTYLIRRSRGYAPDPIKLPFQLPEIIGCGAEQKNTFCLSRTNYAFMSHHIGDLENYETLHAYESGVKHYQNLFKVTPEIVATDLHPDYLSTKFGRDYASDSHIPIAQIQHHHAHLASCLADNSWDPFEPVIGCILDGTGYGEDGHIWGGEFLLGSYTSYSRKLHLREVPLPGGDSSIRNPSKIGIAYLLDAGLLDDHDLLPFKEYSESQIEVLLRQITQKLNTPLTSSMGRLFDAVSSIIGIRQKLTYDAQAAIELEYFCDSMENGRYKIELDDERFDTRTIIRSIVTDYHSGKDIGVISGRFHNTMAYLCLEACNIISHETKVRTVALSGGVWQNRTLLLKTIPLLETNGFLVLLHKQVPTNDGGISLGQVVITAKQKFG